MLEARDLQVRYPGGGLALQDVGVLVHQGEVVAVVGPNGSGKSTLLRVLAGLIRPQKGGVWLNREPLEALPPNRRVGIGIAYAPEGARILPRLSVRDNLLVGAWLRRDGPAVAEDLERVLGLFPALRRHQTRPAVSLSGGERQMVALGRALMSAPRVLLLDEPLLGLDAAARARVVEVIRGLREKRAVVLLAEHDLVGVREMADRAYGLRGGRVVFGGSAAALEHTTAFGEIYD